MIGEARVGPN